MVGSLRSDYRELDNDIPPTSSLSELFTEKELFWDDDVIDVGVDVVTDDDDDDDVLLLDSSSLSLFSTFILHFLVFELMLSEFTAITWLLHAHQLDDKIHHCDEYLSLIKSIIVMKTDKKYHCDKKIS